MSVEHSVDELVAQRIYAIALGYEDLNDHGELRCDAVLSLLVGKTDLGGEKRIRERDRGYVSEPSACPIANALTFGMDQSVGAGHSGLAGTDSAK